MKAEDSQVTAKSVTDDRLARAIQKVGGLRELSRQLEWHSGAISEVLAGKVRLSPYRAAQCAALLGSDPDTWIFDTLRLGAKTEGERAYWTRRIEAARARNSEARKDFERDFPAWLIERAIKKAGGVRALCCDLDWHHGSVMRIKAGERLSPYRAAQIAQYIGVDARLALMAALTAGSKSYGEAEFWKNFDE